jgi:hypothetical protein
VQGKIKLFGKILQLSLMIIQREEYSELSLGSLPDIKFFSEKS